MNLRELRYIIAVAELRHFGRAALACGVSQPTLSGQILKLEEELGVGIFERVGKSITTTGAGEQIVDHARRAVAAADDLLACAKTHIDPMLGPLRLGVIPTLGPYLTPFVLPRAREAMPATPLFLMEDLTARLVALLASSRLDAAIIATDPNATAIEALPLFDEPFFLVLPKDHPLARRDSLEPAEIEPHRLLLLAEGHCLSDQALDLCQHPSLGEDAMADMRATSLQTLMLMAAAGYGMTLAPGLALHDPHSLPATLAARRINGPQASRRVRLVFRQTHPRRRAIAALADLIRSSVPKEAVTPAG